MAPKKYLTLDQTLGRAKQVSATAVSTGVPNAGDIVALDDTGKLDASLLSAGGVSGFTRRVFGWFVEGAVSVANDIGPNYIIDQDIDVLGVSIYAKVGPTTVAAEFDVKFSTNDGTSYASLFSTRPTIPTGSHVGGASAVLSQTTLDAGDVVRFDVIATGTTPAQGVTVQLLIRFR